MHKFQRRNWRRVRVRQETTHILFKQGSIEACWEYGRRPDHDHSFHALRSSYDSYRRRRWTRSLVYSDGGYGSGKLQVIVPFGFTEHSNFPPCSVHKQRSSNKSSQVMPLQKVINFVGEYKAYRMPAVTNQAIKYILVQLWYGWSPILVLGIVPVWRFHCTLICSWYLSILAECHQFQFRAYIYQARDLYSGDKSGLSDPYAIVSFNIFSQATRVVKETRCPVWNQTLMEEDINLCGNKLFITDHNPPVTVEIWDKDMLVSARNVNEHCVGDDD